MKLLNCPLNGIRPISEFIYGGEFRQLTNPESVTDEDWAGYVFHRNNAPGVKKEWWFHSPSSTWFIAERNTATDEVVNTYLLSIQNSEVDSE